MASEIKVDTISEKTSAGGVTIDGLLIKDGGISGDVSLIGTTPTFTIGDAGAEDATLLFDGNAQDFYIALDDSEDDLLIGLGSTVGTTPAISIDSDLKVNIPVTTASTSASTGSLITGGGMGVGADLYVGDDTYLITDSAVLGFGADKDTTLTHTDGTGLTLNSTNKLCFNDVSQFVQGISATVLGLGATDEIDLTATAVDLNGTLDVSGTSTLTGIVTTGSSIATGGEDAPDVNAGGICINQGSADNLIFTLKSSDIAHGITGNTQTDTYFDIQKNSGTEGGAFMQGFSEGTLGMMIFGVHTTDNTAKSTSATAAMELRGKLKSGTSSGDCGSDANLIVIRNNATSRFIFDAEGSFHADVESTTYDEYDDAQLVRAFDLSHKKGVIESKFDKFIAYNHEHLADMKLVGREEDGTPNTFVNVTKFQQLHNGAIWQQYEKHERLLEAVYDLAKEAVGEEKADAILEKHEVKRLQ